MLAAKFSRIDVCFIFYLLCLLRSSIRSPVVYFYDNISDLAPIGLYASDITLFASYDTRLLVDRSTEYIVMSYMIDLQISNGLINSQSFIFNVSQSPESDA